MLMLKDAEGTGLQKLSRSGASEESSKICLVQNSVEINDIKYFAEQIFGKLTFDNPKIKHGKYKICFTIDSPQPEHAIYLEQKGDFLFQQQKTEQILSYDGVRNPKEFILEDIARYS